MGETHYQLFVGVRIFHEEDNILIFKPISPDLINVLTRLRLYLKLPGNEQIYEAAPEEKQLRSGLVWFKNFSPPLTSLQEFQQLTNLQASFLNIAA